MPETLIKPDPALTNDAPWNAYQRPFVRDLAYVLACPNVLTQWIDFTPHQNTHTVDVHSASFWQAQLETYQERLEELDTTTAYQDLTRYLLKRPSPSRLGFHFEGLLSFWLEDGFARQLHPYEMLANNVQLYNGKQTTGELDLILYNHEEKLVEHWELAIKFFMGSAPFAPENWVGINSKDNLERKMTHMQTKQFRSVWVDTEDHGRIRIDKRYGIIKGRFFCPSTPAVLVIVIGPLGYNLASPYMSGAIRMIWPILRRLIRPPYDVHTMWNGLVNVNFMIIMMHVYHRLTYLKRTPLEPDCILKVIDL